MISAIIHLPSIVKESEWYKTLEKNNNTLGYELIEDWKHRYGDLEYNNIVLLRGEREDDDGPDYIRFETFADAFTQLITDIVYDLGTDYELDKIPNDIMKYFYKNDIDVGVLYLESDQIKNVKDLSEYNSIKSKDEILEYINNGKPIIGKHFLLSFDSIRKLLNNNVLTDPELKIKVTKFYSCFRKYIQDEENWRLSRINDIKKEISSLSEENRQQLLCDGQIKRNRSLMTFDEFLYWTHLLKPGDKFETINKTNDDRNIFELLSINVYPKKYKSSTDKTIHSANLTVRCISDENNEPFISNFLQNNVIKDNDIQIFYIKNIHK